MKAPDLPTAARLLTGIHFRRQYQFYRIRLLQKIGASGLSVSEPVFYQQYYSTPEMLKSLGDGDWYFPDPTVFSHEKRSEIAEVMMAKTLTNVQESVDAALLIFAHSVIDDLATSLCEVIATADPMCWESAIIDKEVTLSDARQSTFDKLYSEHLNKFLDNVVKHKSLIKRIQLIHQKCPPTSVPTSRQGNYRYDSKRLQDFDTRRHDIIHRLRWDSAPQRADDDLDFIDSTCGYLCRLISWRYKLEIDVQYGLSSLGKPRSDM